MKYLIIYLCFVIGPATTILSLAKSNITEAANGRPRLNIKQVAFDGVAFIIAMLSFPFLLLSCFLPLAEKLKSVLNYEEPYVFSFLLLLIAQTVVFLGLHYLTAFAQELAYIKARNRYEVKLMLAVKKAYRSSVNNEVENLIKEYELSGRELKIEPEKAERVLKTLHAEDINEGVAELDKIVEFPIDKAK